MMPLGLAVVPDVYSRYRRSSLPMASGGQSADASAMRSWYQWSRPSTIGTSVPAGDDGWPVTRWTTTTSVTDGVLAAASSTAGLSRAGAPRRKPPSAVTMTLAWASLTRSMIESGEKPPKMHEWAAPIRVQASMAMGSSGIIGM